MQNERLFKTIDNKIISLSELDKGYYLLTGNHLNNESKIVGEFLRVKEEINIMESSIVDLLQIYPKYIKDDFEFLSELLHLRIGVLDSYKYEENISELIWDVLRGYSDIKSQDANDIKDEANNDGRIFFQSLMGLNLELRRPYDLASRDYSNDNITGLVRDLFRILSHTSSLCKIHLHNGYVIFYSFGYINNNRVDIQYNINICNGLLNNKSIVEKSNLTYQEFLIELMEYLFKPRISLPCIIVKEENISDSEEFYQFVDVDSKDIYVDGVHKNQLGEYIFRYNFDIQSGEQYIPFDDRYTMEDCIIDEEDENY